MTRPDHLPDTANKNPEGWGAVPGFQSNVSPKHSRNPRRLQVGGDPIAKHAGNLLRTSRNIVEINHARGPFASLDAAIGTAQDALDAIKFCLDMDRGPR